MNLSKHASDFARDVVYAVRTLAKSPAFAAVGIISLGLGIGVTTAIYSDVNVLMLRELPLVKQPKQLVVAQGVSYPYYESYRDQHDLFSGAAAYVQAVPFAVGIGSAGAKTERVFGQIVSPEYFSVMGVDASRGRTFSPEIDKAGSAPVAIVSERFWRNHLHADQNAIGSTMRLNGQTATLVGIMPKDFLGVVPVIPGDLFIPLTSSPKLAPELGDDILHNRDRKIFGALLRLNPGVTATSAEAAVDSITKRLDQETFDPERNRQGRRMRLLPGGNVLPMPPETRPLVMALYVVLTGLILTIACMNLANMLLARAAARRKEIAVRLAIGASRFRLIRQLVTESVTLALCGGIAGILFAYWLTSMFSSMKFPGSIPFEFDIRPDFHVLVFTFILSLIAGVGFGLAPAFSATKSDVAPVLKEGGMAQLRGHRRFGIRNLLMVYQVAGSLMLLLITGFLVLGYSTISRPNVGFDPKTMYLLSLDPIRDGYTQEQTANLFDKLPQRLRDVPAVHDAALTTVTPFTADLGASSFTSGPEEGAKTLRAASKQAIGAGYFSALSVPMIAGREFVDRDTRIESGALPVIVNATAAKELAGTDAVIGHRITEGSQSYEVIGQVPDLSAGIFGGMSSSAILYVPLTARSLARPPAGGMILMVRANAGADALEGIRREIASIDPNLSVFHVLTLDESFDQMNAYIHIGTVFYGGLGIFGLVLASVGLAGVTAYSVARRRKEIGIRMALGARKGQVLRLVLREGSALVIVGSIFGFLGAVLMAKTMSSMLSIFAQVFKTGTGDPRLIIGAPLLLAGLAMFACYLPARKSTEIDPLKALREE